MEKLYHEEIPWALREILEKAGLVCETLYHKKDDVRGFEYIADCIVNDKKIRIGFDIEYIHGNIDLLLAETEVVDEVTPLLASVLPRDLISQNFFL
jgi:hypothetical protein